MQVAVERITKQDDQYLDYLDYREHYIAYLRCISTFVAHDRCVALFSERF